MARIMIVDDDPGVRRIIERMITRCGHTALSASSGIETLTRLKEIPADVMIIDIIMPYMTGVKLIDEIRKLYPAIKIIALSGGGPEYNAETCVELARQHGADDAMIKPATLEKLAATIDKLLALPPRS